MQQQLHQPHQLHHSRRRRRRRRRPRRCRAHAPVRATLPVTTAPLSKITTLAAAAAAAPTPAPVTTAVGSQSASAAAAASTPTGPAVGGSPNVAATIGFGVEVRTSRIAKAGLGLFATREFVRNDLVTEYDGVIITHADAKRLRAENLSSHIRVLSSMHACIDGRNVQPNEKGRGGASFANDPTHNRALVNTKFVQKYSEGLATGGVVRGGLCVMERVFLKATADIIKLGEEIYVTYENDYWLHTMDTP